MLSSIGSRIKHVVSRSGFRDIRRDGTLEFGIGIIFSIFAFDRFLQHKKQEEIVAVHEEKTRALQKFLLEQEQDQSSLSSQTQATADHGGGETTIALARSNSNNSASIHKNNNIIEMEEKTQVLDNITQVHNQQRTEMRQQHLNKPLQFQCHVRKVPEPNMFDGNKSLVGIQVGDVVDVLEEGVGPDGMYNLCRTTRSPGNEGTVRQVGWYPIWFLEKIDSSTNKADTTKPTA
jgi:hypothetical protein